MKPMVRLVLLALVLVAGGLAWGLWPRGSSEVVVGNVRVQALSPTLVRLEERGPHGFEDRATFNVVERAWPGVHLHRSDGEGTVVLSTASWRVVLPQGGTAVLGARVESVDGKLLAEVVAGMPRASFLPDPGKMPGAWLMPDSPRVVPSAWGAVPAPPDKATLPDNGWDLQNQSGDVYAFVPGAGGYEQLRADFLKLTGPVPLPPLFTFGYWTSRWHKYSEDTALEEIRTFRRKEIPLDLFVVDTDWRVGASAGYAVNPTYFPDVERFIKASHALNVRLMFNDHPEPLSSALSPAELQRRWDGLTSLLKLGADVWWYDRNWTTRLAEPVPRLRKEVWGMRLYHDITSTFRPAQRPLIMSNVQGIDSGEPHGPSDPAAHRYPIWWTGDTAALWEYLDVAVQNSVNAGVQGVLPYVHDDCGGHFLKPTPELFTRFFQFCAFSPVLRPHATRGQSRLPWDFGADAERVVTDYARLRMRLLPLLYAAARHAHDDGTPLLSRLDLRWPQLLPAADPRQYLLGEDLLVAPVTSSAAPWTPLPPVQLSTQGQAGAALEVFAGAPGSRVVTRKVVPDFSVHGWPTDVGAAPPEGFSARWTTQWKAPETGVYRVRLDGWGAARLWANGTLLLDDTTSVGDFTANLVVKAGDVVDLRVDHLPVRNGMHVQVLVQAPSAATDTATRTFWVPPGEWEDVWTGERVMGPLSRTVHAGPSQLPLMVRAGGVVMTVPHQSFTGQAPWNTVVADAYVPGVDGKVVRALYEDDGISVQYGQGAFRTTAVHLERAGGKVVFSVEPAQGTHDGAVKERVWVVRLHLAAGVNPREVRVDGEACLPSPGGVCRVLVAGTSVEMPFLGAGQAAGPQGGVVVEVTAKARGVETPTTVELQL